MANTIKITKADRFNQILALVKDNPDLTAFVEHELELLAKRKTSKTEGERKPSKAQKANMDMADKIYAAMAPDTVYANADFKGLVPELAEASSQKITALLNILIKADKVVRHEDKRKVSYTRA